MELTQIEKEYKEIMPDWIDEFHNSLYLGKKMKYDYKYKLHSDFNTCFIGDLRTKLGLPPDYDKESKPEVACYHCERLAYNMMGIIDYQEDGTKKEYQEKLQQIKEHMQILHGKWIK
jgi:hypothetical protein